LSGAARRLTQILQPRRMSIFTIRARNSAYCIGRIRTLISPRRAPYDVGAGCFVRQSCVNPSRPD
jgi:hypothetical protein